MPESATYLLDVGQAAAGRLDLIDEAYGPFTRDFLNRVGLAPGMTALDVGCGTGSVSLWLASRVAPGGRVLGVDSSPDQVAVAQRRAVQQGVGNVAFRTLPAEALDELDERFDLVFARFLLVHLATPEEAVRRMLARVRPGGLLACDEQVLAAACCVPPAPAFAASVALTYRASRSRGLDYDFGNRLFALFAELGCADVALRVVQPALASRAEKQLWPQFFREAGPALVADGHIGEAELADMLAELDQLVLNDGTFILPMRNHQVLGRRPA